MVFGFGFNKAKTFASAEKSVKQGKLHNAIADYEKIAKEDPRDLNVLNTLGDLYARTGNVERATDCFKHCGEAYASEGFTVKAIAMYKKVTKQNPNATEAVAKLAELYAQHGLYNDARMQYSQVVEQYLRSDQLESAIAVLQKMLEFDPENSQLQGRMADLYVRIGKKAEARDLYFRTAQALRLRGSLEACDKALASVLELEPGFAQAVLLRGQVKLEAGDAAGCMECLESLPDIDSRPEALRLLLQACLNLSNREAAEPLARKLLTVYSDPGGISQYADHLISSGQFDAALGLYDEYADRLLATDAASVVQTLHALIGRVKDHAQSLERLSLLFQKAGDTTHLAEVTELLAHACVHDGELEKARDLYHRLSEMEPENPLHVQNYRQILAKLGEDAGTSLSDEGAPAFLMDELDEPPAGLVQDYSPEVKSALQEALTDSELFTSYNLPARAIPLLEAVLPQAPQDVQLNQRLASLYTRTGQFAEAAERCSLLRNVYATAGFATEAKEYAELTARYRERAGLPPEPAPLPENQSVAGPGESAAASGHGADTSDTGTPLSQPATDAQAGDTTPVDDLRQPWAAPVTPPVTAAPALEIPPAQAEPVAHEIDLSEEWDRVLNSDDVPALGITQDLPVAIDPGSATLPESSPWDAPTVARPSPATAAAVGDLVEEARFYISQSMWNEARTALSRAEAMVPGAPAVVELQAQLSEGIAGLPVPDAPESAPLPTFPGIAAVAAASAPEPAMSLEHGSQESERPSGTLDGFVASLEHSLGPDFVIEAPEPAAKDVAVQSPQQESVDPGAALSSLFDEFKRDMESSAEPVEDVETQYNMGLAFKEMGLFDEAIAEFQKAASAIEQGAVFPQVLETYTWLADCFVNKGVPEAGAHWYQKALALPGLTPEQALAVSYELACAEQAAGDIAAARSHFMHVLSLNIDYRDVAERIKALKS